jgi:hypothetical protein
MWWDLPRWPTSASSSGALSLPVLSGIDAAEAVRREQADVNGPPLTDSRCACSFSAAAAARPTQASAPTYTKPQQAHVQPTRTSDAVVPGAEGVPQVRQASVSVPTVSIRALSGPHRLDRGFLCTSHQLYNLESSDTYVGWLQVALASLV